MGVEARAACTYSRSMPGRQEVLFTGTRYVTVARINGFLTVPGSREDFFVWCSSTLLNVSL